jgi:hypothetical protein
LEIDTPGLAVLEWLGRCAGVFSRAHAPFFLLKMAIVGVDPRFWCVSLTGTEEP